MIAQAPKFLAFLMAAVLFLSACSTHSEPVARSAPQVESIAHSEPTSATEARVSAIDFDDDVTTIPEVLLGGVAIVGFAGICAMVGVLPCLL